MSNGPIILVTPDYSNKALAQPPEENSLADTLHKDGSYTYDNTTDSLEAISDAVSVVTTELAQRAVAKAVAVSTTKGETGSGYEVIVNITDKGVLTGVSQTFIGTSLLNGALKITIDGTVILTDLKFTMSYTTADDLSSYHGYSSLAFNHRFNTSLKVEACKAGVGDIAGNTVYTKVSYTID